jgi:hypothetical protein
MTKHNLIDKYFNNFTNFNSNNLSLKEEFNTFNFYTSQNLKSPKLSYDNFNYGKEGSLKN